MTRPGKRKWSLIRFLPVLVALAFLLVAGLAVFLHVYGVPSALLAGIARNISTGNFTIEPASMKLGSDGGLRLDSVKVFRKGIIGPPVADISFLNIEVDFLGLVPGRRFLRGVTLRNGVFNPGMFAMGVFEESLHGDMDIRMDLVMENCVADGLVIEDLRGVLFVDSSSAGVENVYANLPCGAGRNGVCRGAVIYSMADRRMNGRIEAVVDPHILLTVLQRAGMPFTAELIQRFTFRGALPRYEADFELSAVDDMFGLEFRVWLSDCAYRGVDVLRADGTVKVDVTESNAVVRVDPLLVTRRDGHVEGMLEVDIEEHTVRFDAVSTIDPEDLMRMIGMYDEKIMSSWRFEGPVRIAAAGMADYHEGLRSKVEASVSGIGMGIGGLIADEANFDLIINDAELGITNIAGRIYGGTFTGDAGITLVENINTGVIYKVSAKVNRIDAGELLAALDRTDIKNFSGNISFDGQINGSVMDNIINVKGGTGRISISDGKIFSLPVFGGLSELLKKIIPGLDFVLRQSDMKADFAIAGGKVRSEKILVDGDIFSLSGKGDYIMAEQKLAYEVQLRLLKAHTVAGRLMRVITYPISKLFEFRLTGDIRNPRWYPLNFSSDLLEELGFKRSETIEEFSK